MKKILTIITISMFFTFSVQTVSAQDAFCPGFTCGAGQQCQKNPDNSYYCADCPKDASGNPLCRTNTGTGSTDGITAIGTVLPPASVDSSPNAIWNYVPTGLTASYFIALLLVLAFLIWGGVKWITAGGDPKALAAAQATIMNAIIGLILLSIAFIVTKVLESWLNNTDNRTFAPGTVVYTYTCGNGNSPISEQRTYCQTQPQGAPIQAESWNQMDPQQRQLRCISRSECDAGCLRNDQIRQEYERTGNPADPYIYCRL